MIDYLLQKDVISVSKDICGGVPVLKGTRMPVYRILAELTDLSAIEIADDFDLNINQIILLLQELSIYFEKYGPIRF